MIFWMFRLFLIIVAIAFLYTIDVASIELMIGDYQVYSNLPSFILFLLIIIVPISLFFKLIRAVATGIHRKYYYEAAIKLLNTFSFEDEKNFIIEILRSNNKLKVLKEFRRIKSLINNEKYDKALYACNAMRVKSSLKVVILYFEALIYRAKNSKEEYITVCRQGADLSQNNAWFFERLIEEAIKSKNKSDFIYLNDSVNVIQFITKERYENAFCLIKYYLAEMLLQEGEEDKAYKMAYEVQRKYPGFAPIYKILIKIKKQQGDDKKIKELLQTAWIEDQNYDVIELWMKYYPERDMKVVLQDLQKVFTFVKNKDMNVLLLAGVHTKLNKVLEAHEAIEKINPNDINRKLVEMVILEKEKNYNKMYSLWNSINHKLKSTWWSKVIK